MINAPLIGGLATLLYLAAAGLLGLRLTRGQIADARPNKGHLILLGLVATLLHAVILKQLILTEGGFNLNLTNISTFIGWLISLLLLLAATRRPVENLGIALLPLTATTLLIALLLPTRGNLLVIDTWPLQAHILISVLAYSLLTIAAVQAVLLAVQDHQLRHRRPGGLIRSLPPLQVMESLLFQMITLGFVFLTIALLSGVLFIEDMFAQHLAHKTILSLTAWIVFATLLWGRFRFGWRGRIAIRWTLGGFTTLMFAYFGSKIVLELLLP